jgi:hypothetical protein
MARLAKAISLSKRIATLTASTELVLLASVLAKLFFTLPEGGFKGLIGMLLSRSDPYCQAHGTSIRRNKISPSVKLCFNGSNTSSNLNASNSQE